MNIEVVVAGMPESRLRQWHAVEVAAAEDTRTWPLPAMTFEELRGHAQHPGGDPISRYEATLAVDDDDEVVGFTHGWWIAADNKHLVDVSVHVHPERRREGVGSELLRDRIAAARAGGRSAMMLGAPVSAPGAAFLEHHGAKPSLLERRSLLDVRSVERTMLEASAPTAAGYRLEQWNEVPPEDLLPSLARAQESMDDAPKGELDLRRESWTLDMIRAIYASSAARGYRRFVVAAIHEASGEVAGLTEIKLPPGGGTYGEQNDTVVVPAHRGHRLGMSMKSAMLLWLSKAVPELEQISTWNAEENNWMLAVNIALGFRPAEHWQMYQLTL